MIDHNGRKAYRPDEFGAFFGMSAKTIRRRIEDGDIQAVKLGRCLLVPASEVDRIAGHGAESSSTSAA